MPSQAILVIGIDLGGTNMQFGVVDAQNGIVGRTKKKTMAQKGSDEVIARLVDGVHDACTDAEVELAEIAAVGIAAAGAIDTPNGMVLSSPNIGWVDFPLRDALHEKLGRPVVLENDVNGAVWGEYCLGAGRGCSDVFGIWVGTGVGGGLVVNGKLHRGHFFTAGEIGHVVADLSLPRGAAKVEEIASRTGMSRAVIARRHAYPDSIMHDLISPERGIYRSRILSKALEADDQLMTEVVAEAARTLGVAIANVVTLLSLERVILGGGVSESLGKPFLESIRKAFEEHVFPDDLRACELVPTALEDEAGLLGAALLAREAVLVKAQ
ncbi:MAG: ROK family protein [Phycisphaerales bacterium]